MSILIEDYLKIQHVRAEGEKYIRSLVRADMEEKR